MEQLVQSNIVSLCVMMFCQGPCFHVTEPRCRFFLVSLNRCRNGCACLLHPSVPEAIPQPSQLCRNMSQPSLGGSLREKGINGPRLQEEEVKSGQCQMLNHQTRLKNVGFSSTIGLGPRLAFSAFSSYTASPFLLVSSQDPVFLKTKRPLTTS